MERCQHCGVRVSRLVPFTYTSGGFTWDILCETCHWNLKLEDWNDSCRLIPKETRHAVH